MIQNNLNCIRTKFNNNKEQLFHCFLYTFIIGMIAHGYMYFQDSFSHDSLNEFNAEIYGNCWKVQLGRFFVPVYRFIFTSNIIIPWLAGLYSLLWIAIAVFIMTKMFNMKSKMNLFLICGIFVTNITVIALTATYIHDLDSSMFAMLMAVSSVYMWKSYDRGYLMAVPMMVIVLAIYQAYISLAAILIVFFIIIELLNEKSSKQVFKEIGYKAIVMIVLSCVLYLLINILIQVVFDIQETNSYNSLSNILKITPLAFIISICKTYIITIYELLFCESGFGKIFNLIITLALIIPCAVKILTKIFDKNFPKSNRWLILLSLFMVPAIVGVSQIFANGMVHNLMHFALWMVYLLPLILLYKVDYSNPKETLPRIRNAKVVCGFLVIMLIFGNIKLSNELYLKKDLEQDANIALYTRVWDRMELVTGYDREEMPVVFLGKPDYYNLPMQGFEKSHELVGGNGNYIVGTTSQNRYASLFKYKFHYPIKTLQMDEVRTIAATSEVLNMPCFPAEGSIKIIDGVLVVKMGE